jgi:hypothetical protein
VTWPISDIYIYIYIYIYICIYIEGEINFLCAAFTISKIRKDMVLDASSLSGRHFPIS